jgi:hypothetical protein
LSPGISARLNAFFHDNRPSAKPPFMTDSSGAMAVNRAALQIQATHFSDQNLT